MSIAPEGSAATELHKASRHYANPRSQQRGALNSREREIVSLRRQLDAEQNDLTSLHRDKDVAIRENRRLQDDLTTMTREVQVRHESELRIVVFRGVFR